MYGPDFLILYFVVILTTITVCVLLTRQAASTEEFSPVQLPIKPDPFEIAYLRGGTAEVARLMIYDLLQKCLLLRTSDDPVMVRATNEPLPDGGISSIAQQVLEFFVAAKPPYALLSTPVIASIDRSCAGYATDIERQGLVLGAAERTRISKIRWTGILTVGGLGLYKLIAALSTEHDNVGFLLVMLVIGSLTVNGLCKTPRLSQRGRKYLSQIQTAFGQLRKPQFAAASGAIDEAGPLLAVGIFGFAALHGTEHAVYARMFRRAANSSGCSSYSSCSMSGCGSSSSCGSGSSSSSSSCSSGSGDRGCGGGGGGD
jgi:uncharacterized protein (TIGR04222 family)